MAMLEANRLIVELAMRALEEETTGQEDWWYCSFANDAGFEGAILVRAKGVITARLRVDKLGFSPRGSMLAVPVNGRQLPDATFLERLLSKPELDVAFANLGGVATVH